MTRKPLLPPGAPRPVSYYSHGIRVRSTLYSAGQTARDQTGQLVGLGDVDQQAQRAFHNLTLVLQEGNMQIKNVVRLNIFVRQMSDLPAIMAVQQQFFGDHKPAVTTAAVESLAYPEYLLEVEAIAVSTDAA